MTTAVQAVEAPQELARVRFRRDGDRICVSHAPPVMWFARQVLERALDDPPVGLSFHDDIVTLRADNGRWVWRLTGRTKPHRFTPDAEPSVMVEGVWPD